MKRTHTCGDITKKDVKKTVVLEGWLHSRRDHGGLIFIDLRDRYGFTQVVFDPKVKDAFTEAESLRRETIIRVSGKVRLRPKGMENANLKTGDVEVLVEELTVLAAGKLPPFEIDDRIEPSEELRLKYRYLDLRRPKMVKGLEFRQRVIDTARAYFVAQQFLEVTTPLLVKTTPEGARDYVVPSRVHPGMFYALPQSPQLYKQILMIAGVDRYFQFATCLRDEDLRADRQPEHMQMDLEMSFVEQEDVMGFVEGLYKHIFKNVLNQDLPQFPILSYYDAMERFGSDKPDLRFGLELFDVTDTAKKTAFSVFTDAIKDSGVVKCINPSEVSRKEVDDLIEFAKQNGAKGMAWVRVTKDGLESNIVKYFPADVQKELIKKTNAKEGSMLLFVADKRKVANGVLGKLRLELGKKFKLIKEGVWKFCWITEFPLFAWDEETQQWAPEHHMFTAPKQEHVQYLEKDPGKVIGRLFDVVLNGTELGSGSIRINDPIVQERVMKVIGMTKEEARAKFGFLLEAYEFGAPQHGGMGLGVDRLVALMWGTNDIREVIAFPKNKAAQGLMDGCPSPPDAQQLKELHLKTDIVKK